MTPPWVSSTLRLNVFGMVDPTGDWAKASDVSYDVHYLDVGASSIFRLVYCHMFCRAPEYVSTIVRHRCGQPVPQRHPPRICGMPIRGTPT